MNNMPDAFRVLESVNDGIYITDVERRLCYWNPAAERITGWRAEDIIGRTCYDDILCHQDKDGRKLCGKEHCPLHRAIITGNGSSVPIIVFAGRKDGGRVPVHVNVAPIFDDKGTVIGGVETFRDLSPEITDFERAQKIQSNVMRVDLAPDPRMTFRAHRVPVDVVGGDFVAVSRLSEDSRGFLLADVSGHGIAAGLYTMCIHTLMEQHKSLLSRPGAFADAVSRGLCDLMGEEGAFAAATCGSCNLAQGTVRLAGAGNPHPILFPRSGGFRKIECTGLPLGMMAGAEYPEVEVNLAPGDCLLLFTDGASDISTAPNERLGVEGLAKQLLAMGYPHQNTDLAAVELELLRMSDCIRFDDDLTMLEVRRTPGT